MKQLAIIGPTASGKSDLALSLAARFGGVILSLDSLSIYRHIDIASAKPTPEERGSIPHVGIDELEPDEPFNVTGFFSLYEKAAGLAGEAPLWIVGGTGFYLKMLMEGIGDLPEISDTIRQKTARLLTDLPAAFALLEKRDPVYAGRFGPHDRYRIEKGLLILLATDTPPSLWYEQARRMPHLPGLPVFEIEVSRDLLRERIARRTRTMFEWGLIDEVAFLEQHYGRAPQSMGAIGIKEVLAFFDGQIDIKQCEELIATHTGQLAKRQQSYNRSQFPHAIRAPLETMEAVIVEALKEDG